MVCDCNLNCGVTVFDVETAMRLQLRSHWPHLTAIFHNIMNRNAAATVITAAFQNLVYNQMDISC
jgi:hypothetical protein